MEYYTEAQAEEFAKNASKTIVVKDGKDSDGNAIELRRDSTPEEAFLIEKIIFGGLLAVKGNIGNENKFTRYGHIGGAKDAAEFIGDLLFDWNINGYLTVYCPICEFLKDYE